MKVLYVTNLPAPYRVDFFNALGKQVDLTVLYERKTATDRDTRWTGSQAQSFREVFLRGIKTGTASGASLEVLSFIKDPSFDVRVISGYSSPTAMLAISYMKQKKIPYILSVDGGFPRKEHPLMRKWKTYLMSGASLYLSTGTNADRFLTCYGADKNRICRYRFASLWEKDVLCSPPSLQEKASLKRKLGLDETKKTVLYVGRLLDWKRHDLVIRAAEQFPEAQFRIVGGIPDAYHQKLLDRSSARNIRFVDFMSYPRLAEFYQAADVFFMPSEGDIWGLVLAEAMANGLPVVASYGCGAAEDLIVDGQNGYITKKGDENALLSRLGTLLQSDTTDFGTRSLEIGKEFTIENEVCDHLQAFHLFRSR